MNTKRWIRISICSAAVALSGMFSISQPELQTAEASSSHVETAGRNQVNSNSAGKNSVASALSERKSGRNHENSKGAGKNSGTSALSEGKSGRNRENSNSAGKNSVASALSERKSGRNQVNNSGVGMNPGTSELSAKKSGADQGERQFSRRTVQLQEVYLKTARVISENNRFSVQVKWKASSGGVFQILRRSGTGPFRVIASTWLSAGDGEFTDDQVKPGKMYCYSIRRVLSLGNVVGYGSFDTGGISVTTALPKEDVSFTNLYAEVTWKPVPGAAFYRIYRKTSSDGHYRLLQEVPAESARIRYSYRDVYAKSLSDTQMENLHVEKDSYLDLSENPFHYAVMPVIGTQDPEGREKTGYGNYRQDGTFHLETPVIISVSKIKEENGTAVVREKNNSGTTPTGKESESEKTVSVKQETKKVRWGTVANAQIYRIYSGQKKNGKIRWKLCKEVPAKEDETQKTGIRVSEEESYVTVKALAPSDRKMAESGYDSSFTTSERKFRDRKVLFIGDSITYGAPYREPERRHLYSYAKRVSQLTGAYCYNPSISGATLSWDWKRFSENGVYSLYGQVVLPISRAQVPVMPDYLGNDWDSHSFYSYDCVVLECGTNDYSWNVPPGDADSTDIRTYGGALNQTMRRIQTASEARVRDGKKPIRIVILDLFYSDRVGKDWEKKNSRFTHENSIGYNLKDYQKVIDRTVRVWKDRGLTIRQFQTGRYVNKENAGYTTADNLHLTKYTASRVGSDLSAFLMQKVFRQ